MSTLFTSDLHYFHRNVIKYCNRPWDFENQTAELIARWNSRVQPGDTVVSLGDFAFAGPSKVDVVGEILDLLNGEKFIVRGNHCDKKLWARLAARADVLEVTDYAEFKINKQKICMSHYPMVVWNGSHYGSWMLHGHCHGSYQPTHGRILDVGIDNHPERTVWTFEEIEEYMSAREWRAEDHHVDR